MPSRNCIEGILWFLKTGARWQDLPDRYPSFATVLSVEGIRGHRKCIDSIDPAHGSAKSAELVEVVWRWDVFASKKRGLEVGKTKQGKGTKIMVMTEANGLPISTFTTSAQIAEVNTIEILLTLKLPDHESPSSSTIKQPTLIGCETHLQNEKWNR